MTDRTGAGRIDIHHHFYAPEYREVMESYAQMPQVRDWTLQRTLEEMDGNNIDSAMLSLSPPGIHRGTEQKCQDLARTINEHAAALHAERPDRFGHFATVPMPDVDATLSEIAHALDTLGADGIQLMTSYGDRWPGHPDFDAVFDDLNRRKAVVFIHPLEPDCCAGIIGWVPPVLTEFTQDTARCVFSLLFSGTLARCPDIRFILCHAGGAVPVTVGRAEQMGLHNMFADRIPNGIDHELQRLYYDVALSSNRPALSALFSYVAVSQVLLGTDYPFGGTAETIRGLEEFGLDAGDLHDIHRGNAERLIPRLKA
ncbi:MAG: amidohydrolase family protein [Pseudomonadota bacterium]|nr:amidohydrolase family protein [Pseudomonadota bacterium]